MSKFNSYFYVEFNYNGLDSINIIAEINSVIKLINERDNMSIDLINFSISYPKHTKHKFDIDHINFIPGDIDFIKDINIIIDKLNDINKNENLTANDNESTSVFNSLINFYNKYDIEGEVEYVHTRE